MLPWELAPHLPWRVFMNPIEQWESLPTFLIGEYVVIASAVTALYHARRSGRGHLLIWFAALAAGTGNDLLFMALPWVDNFWQAQATVMLTPRLPFYIVCMYIVFMYWPTVAVRRLNLRAMPAAALTGLAACLLYAPYDIVGAKFLWWTWHDTDSAIAARILGAPASSSLWVLTFTGSFALLGGVLLRDGEASWRRFGVGLILLACLTTPAMVVQMTLLQTIDGGIPGYLALLVGVAVYAATALAGLRADRRTASANDWLGAGAVSAFLLMLAFNMTFFAPETHVSTGVHQLPGPCDAREADVTGAERRTVLCVEDYEEDFTFDCATPPADGAGWYTICGKAHTNYAGYAVGVGTLALGGILLFGLLFRSDARPGRVGGRTARGYDGRRCGASVGDGLVPSRRRGTRMSGAGDGVP